MSVDVAARGLAAQARALSLTNAARIRAFGAQTIIAAGDSITQGGTVLSNGNWLFSPSYAETSIYKAGPRFRLLRNVGIAGNTSTQLLARWQSDVLDYKPDFALVMIGTNDSINGGTPAQLATWMNNHEAIVVRSLASGTVPIIVTPPAKDSARPEMRRAIPYYYRLANAYGLPLIDVFKVTVDPVSGGYKTGISDDGTHPNAAGIAVISTEVAAVLRNLISYVPLPYLAAYAETTSGQPANLIRNGNFAQQSVAGSPDGWGFSVNNATRDATGDAALPYNGKEVVYTNIGAPAKYALSGSAIGGLTAGDLLVFSGSIEVSGLPASPLGFNVALEGGQPGLRVLSGWKHNGVFGFSGEMVVQAGYTSIGPNIYMNDVGVYKVRNLTAINRTAMDSVWKPANGY